MVRSLTQTLLALEPSEVGVIPPEYRTQFSRESHQESFRTDSRPLNPLAEQWNTDEVRILYTQSWQNLFLISTILIEFFISSSP